MSDTYQFEYFTVQFPADHKYVAHVEINRPGSLNAFIEV
jgi:delta(3,5)-delta(2,4)-dienoyl-CoA isomerase